MPFGRFAASGTFGVRRSRSAASRPPVLLEQGLGLIFGAFFLGLWDAETSIQKGLMALAFQKYGTVKSSIIADRIKNLTFHYATRSGISISIEDLRVPYKKKQLIGLTSNEVNATEEKY